MQKAEGVLILSDAWGTTRKIKTFKCMHCQTQRPDASPYFVCTSCDARVCARAECTNVCHHFERKLEEAEARARFRASL